MPVKATSYSEPESTTSSSMPLSETYISHSEPGPGICHSILESDTSHFEPQQASISVMSASESDINDFETDTSHFRLMCETVITRSMSKPEKITTCVMSDPATNSTVPQQTTRASASGIWNIKAKPDIIIQSIIRRSVRIYRQSNRQKISLLASGSNSGNIGLISVSSSGSWRVVLTAVTRCSGAVLLRRSARHRSGNSSIVSTSGTWNVTPADYIKWHCRSAKRSIRNISSVSTSGGWNVVPGPHIGSANTSDSPGVCTSGSRNTVPGLLLGTTVSFPRYANTSDSSGVCTSGNSNTVPRLLPSSTVSFPRSANILPDSPRTSTSSSYNTVLSLQTNITAPPCKSARIYKRTQSTKPSSAENAKYSFPPPNTAVMSQVSHPPRTSP